MNHNCKNWWVNLAGGQVYCDMCGEEYFFTDLGIKAKEIIHSGEYDLIDENGIPEHDLEMIQFFKEQEEEKKSKKLKVFEKLSGKKQRLWIKNEYDYHKKNYRNFNEDEIESAIRDSLFSSFNTNNVTKIKARIHEVISN